MLLIMTPIQHTNTSECVTSLRFSFTPTHMNTLKCSLNQTWTFYKYSICNNNLPKTDLTQDSGLKLRPSVYVLVARYYMHQHVLQECNYIRSLVA